nr:Chain A, Temporin-B [Rana temporaria]
LLPIVGNLLKSLL